MSNIVDPGRLEITNMQVLEPRFFKQLLEKAEGAYPPYPAFGVKPLDEYLHIDHNLLHIVAGRPSQGRATLALSAAAYTGQVLLLPTLVVRDDDPLLLMERLLSQSGGINLWGLRNGTLSSDDWSNLSQALECSRKAQIQFAGPAVLKCSFEELSKLCGTELRLIVLDCPEDIEASLDTVREWSSHLPVIATVNVNPAVDYRTCKTPALDDLPADIESAAESVITIVRKSTIRLTGIRRLRR